jgi:hypothetical protein
MTATSHDGVTFRSSENLEKLVRSAGQRHHRTFMTDKEIDMTRRSRLRFGAGLLAIACLAVGLGVSGSAGASPSAEAAKKAGNSSCPPRTICLWPGHFSGKRRSYHCGNKPRGRSYSIALDFPLNARGGVSSYRNNGIREASLATIGPVTGASITLPPDSGGTNRSNRLLRKYDDQASALNVTC